MAAASVQPVPCVFLVAMRAAAKRTVAVAVTRRSALSAAFAVAALHQHGLGARARAGARPGGPSRLRSSACGASSSAAASGRFGVTTSASGTSFVRIASTASGVSRRSPDVATITGSSTTGVGGDATRPLRHGFDDRGIAEHADLHRADSEVGEHRIHLRRTKAGGTSRTALTPLGVLRGERGDHRGAVDAERREGLQVGLDAGAAAGIRAGDGDVRWRWARAADVMRRRPSYRHGHARRPPAPWARISSAPHRPRRAARAPPPRGRGDRTAPRSTETPSAPAAITASAFCRGDAGDAAGREIADAMAKHLDHAARARRARSATCRSSSRSCRRRRRSRHSREWRAAPPRPAASVRMERPMNGAGPSRRARFLDAHVVLADMHAVGLDRERNLDAVVDDERHAERRQRRLERARLLDHVGRAR